MSDRSLAEAQKANGAVFSDRQAEVPHVVHYGDPCAESTATQQEAAVFDLSDRSQIELTGADRSGFLHNFCTNNILALEPGQGCEAFVTNVKGRVLGHVFVFAGEQSIWLESVADSEERLLTHLDRYLITEDVTLQGQTALHAELFVTGPLAAEKLQPFDPDAGQLAAYAHRSVPFTDHPMSIRRVDLLGQPGYLLAVVRHDLANLWGRLVETGFRPAGLAAFEPLRIEAGVPLYGTDFSEDNLAQEVGRTQQCISFTKGCYLGQEPIARIDALGHVNRELRGLRLSTGPVPPPGSSVVSTDEASEIGQITSSALSPGSEAPVALAYLRRAFVDPGTEVKVKVDGTATPATVFWPTS